MRWSLERIASPILEPCCTSSLLSNMHSMNLSLKVSHLVISQGSIYVETARRNNFNETFEQLNKNIENMI